jgi:adenosine deaminase
MSLDKVDWDINTSVPPNTTPNHRSISPSRITKQPLTNGRFFPLFSRYIYQLCNNLESIKFSTRSVLQTFSADGVRYLELRTTPRAIPTESLSKDLYVRTILDEIHEFTHAEPSNHYHPTPSTPSSLEHVYLILSIDRRNTPAEALETVALALKYAHYRGHHAIVGIDLCGDPSVGDVSIFAEAFAKARAGGLKSTIHFAEVPASSTRRELEMLLSFQPDRLGHVIHVPEDLRAEIARRELGLELCLSCNVHAKMTQGGFKDHHFGYWREKRGRVVLCVGLLLSSLDFVHFLYHHQTFSHTTCPALNLLVYLMRASTPPLPFTPPLFQRNMQLHPSYLQSTRSPSQHLSLLTPKSIQTDDVGVFGSPLSNEYLVASQHFNLGRDDLIQLSLNATRDIFSPEEVKEGLRGMIEKFRRFVDVPREEVPI